MTPNLDSTNLQDTYKPRGIEGDQPGEEETKTIQPANLALALQLAGRGWYVFPCHESGDKAKRPYTQHGKDDATTDQGIITDWWKRWPGALIGIYCEKSGIFAVDIDAKNGHDGFLTWQKLVDNQEDDGLPNIGPRQYTPSGGAHLIFSLPADLKIPNNAGKLGDGLDLRSNGYICTGGAYEWIPGHGPESTLRAAPGWLLQAIRDISSPQPVSRPITGKAEPRNASGEYWLNKALARAGIGSRNDSGFWLACQLRDSGMSKSEAESVMRSYVGRVPQGNGAIYAEAEALASLREAYKSPPRTPAQSLTRHNGNGHNTAYEPDDYVPALEGMYPPDNWQDADNIPNQAGGETLESDDIAAKHDDYCPELPESARVDLALGAGVGQWLTDYENFSRQWSPRAYDGFHTACGLWLLSTIAARRVCFHMGKPRYTNLYISLTARTSLYAKSTTAEIALQTLRCINVDWLLAADSATPQKFISDLTTKLPTDYDDMNINQKERARLRVGMSGQRGWYYDEFGQHVSAMMRDGGFMADFRGLLRRFDDTPESYESGSIARGSEIIERPYLALLANMTPDDLKPFARRGSALWGDGFLARFVLITPPIGERLRDRFPKGERKIPEHILKPLAAWHSRLGLPKVNVESGKLENGEKPGNQLDITPLQANVLEIPQDTEDAFNNYHDALLDILDSGSIKNNDLDGNYARLAEKALRVAAILSSLDDKKSISIEYWARAQGIVETWRAGLHRLYNQINLPGQSQASENEERLLSIIQEKKNPTRRELHQYSKLAYKDIDFTLTDLIKADEVEEVINGKTKKYLLKGRSVENVDM